MRTKQLTKKLTLNKSTVARLNKEEIGSVHGGIISGQATCGKLWTCVRDPRNPANMIYVCQGQVSTRCGGYPE